MLGKKTAVAAATAAAAALALSACSGGGASGANSGGSGKNGSGTLTIGALVVPASYAADTAAWANQSPYEQAVYDTLVQETPDGKIVPWLAKSWSYNADNTVLTMKLRTDVTFTDGTPFDANAAAQNLTRFKNGTSPLRSYLALMTEAKAVDPSTLQITLSAPNPALLQYLSGAAGLQESPKNFGAATEKTTPVGSGPYILDPAKTVIGSTYVYTRNPHYWAPQEQHYARLVINVYQKTPTQVNAIRGGQVNGLELLDNTAVNQVKAAGYQIKASQLNWVGLELFDRDGVLTPALKDVRVRQAINDAIDSKAMLKAVGENLGTVTTQVFNPRDGAAYDPSLNSQYPYDPKKAKQLLAEAGYANGFSVTIPEVPTGSTALYDLTKQYLGAVGITVNYVSEPLNNFLADTEQAKFSIVSLPLQTDPTAWEVANFKLLPTATWNPFHVADPTVESLAAKLQMGDTAAGRKLDQYIVQQAWFDPWYRPQNSYAVDSHTTADPQYDNAYPYLWNITPKA